MRCAFAVKTVAVAVAVAALSTASSAGESKGSFFVGAGYVKAADVDGGSPYFTGGFRLHVTPTLAVEPEFSYWKKSEGLQELLRLGVSDSAFSANLVFKPKMEGPVGVYLGMGPSVHLAKLSASVLGLSDSDTQTKMGGQAFVGADVRVTAPLSFFATARYDVVAKPEWGEDIGQVNISAFKIYGGLRLNF